MKSSATGGKRLANSYIAFAGILDQISGKIREVSTANLRRLSRSNERRN